MAHPSPIPEASTSLSKVSAGLGAQLLLEIGLKRVVRELHDKDGLQRAINRWTELGYQTVAGEVIQEDEATASMVTDVDSEHTIRPLSTHPVVERVVRLTGPLGRRVLLHPSSPVYQHLCERWGADQAPVVAARSPRLEVHERVALFVSTDEQDARRARELDRMSAEDTQHDDAELGSLLGYPPCCVEAYAALQQRWPNRLPIEAAARRTAVFQPRLNNVALDRFAWIAHFPCSYDCAASLELADAAAARLEARSPGLAARLDAMLAVPRVWWSDSQQAALEGAKKDSEGRIAFERITPLDSLWPGQGEARRRADQQLDLPQGLDRVRLTSDGPVFERRGKEVRVGGDPLVLPFGLG